MKGSTKIVNRLNELLSGELTAADQYFIHSRMYEDWGLGVLSERIKHESEEELEHADALIKRILFLDGTPDLSVRAGLKIGSTAAETPAPVSPTGQDPGDREPDPPAPAGPAG